MSKQYKNGNLTESHAENRFNPSKQHGNINHDAHQNCQKTSLLLLWWSNTQTQYFEFFVSPNCTCRALNLKTTRVLEKLELREKSTWNVGTLMWRARAYSRKNVGFNPSGIDWVMKRGRFISEWSWIWMRIARSISPCRASSIIPMPMLLFQINHYLILLSVKYWQRFKKACINCNSSLKQWLLFGYWLTFTKCLHKRHKIESKCPIYAF